LPRGKANLSLVYIAALVCLVAVALFMFSKSDFFLVKDVKCEGLNIVAENEVLRLLGTVKGENIFLLDTRALAQKIKLHPLIEQAEVQKKYPASLLLKIQERVPAALILDGDRMVEIDQQGIILHFYYDTWPQKDCPVINGIKVPGTMGPGQKVDNPELAKALLLIGQASDEIKKIIGEIHLAEDKQVFLYLTTGKEVKLGHGEDYAAKLKILEELLSNIEYKTVEQAVKYIDLTADKPVLGLPPAN